jgi:hypothetical protein
MALRKSVDKPETAGFCKKCVGSSKLEKSACRQGEKTQITMRGIERYGKIPLGEQGPTLILY